MEGCNKLKTTTNFKLFAFFFSERKEKSSPPSCHTIVGVGKMGASTATKRHNGKLEKSYKRATGAKDERKGPMVQPGAIVKTAFLLVSKRKKENGLFSRGEEKQPTNERGGLRVCVCVWGGGRARPLPRTQRGRRQRPRLAPELRDRKGTYLTEFIVVCFFSSTSTLSLSHRACGSRT
jgi:hypothetical protein